VSRPPFAIAGLFAILALGASPSPQPQSHATERPLVIAADRHDRSPRLRDIPPLPPAIAHEPDEREPKPWRQRRRPPTVATDPAVQTSWPAITIPAPVSSFDGIANVNGVLPPDTNGDVGPNHYVQWVNLSFAIYGKTGQPDTPPTLIYGPAAGNTLWTGFGGPCETRNDGDPIVLYDQLADRWVMSQLALPNSFAGILVAPFYQCLAISATPDPTGAYYRYQFAFNKLNDYPKLAVWPDAYYMTINQFSQASLQFAGQGVVAFDRQKMLAGLPATMVYFDLPSVDMNLGGMLPADLDGPPPPADSPGYFMQVDDDAWGYAPDELQLWRFHVDWTNASASFFSRGALLPTAPFDSNLCDYSRTCLPQPSTTARLDAMADRLMYRLQYRNFGTHESLVVNHTVDADGTDHAGIRWYEVRNPSTTPVIFQQGTYAPDADHRWMGSAAMDGSGNIALGFSVSGVATSPSVRYTGRLASDAPGAMTLGEADLIVGSGSQSHGSGRWGDYSMMAVDPADDCTFWYAQEYYASSSDVGWRTRIGTFSFPSCATSSTVPSVNVVATTSMAAEAGQTAGVFTVTRSGDTSAPLTVRFTVGGTATAGSDYLVLPAAVTIPADASQATLTVMPVDDQIAEPNETVTLSLQSGSEYRLGSPSFAIVTVVSDDVPPDLVVTALAAPPAGGAGGTIVVTDTTKNQGSGVADVSATGFYLSANTLLDSADVLLGSRAVASLAAGESSAASTTLMIPGNAASGAYFVIAKADVNTVVLETQEGNNVKASGRILIGPDLVVSSLTAPAAAVAGSAVVISDTTTNQGGSAAAASSTSLYLSANAALDTSDVLLGTRAVPLLGSNAADSGSMTVMIPSTTTAGLYYLLAKADAANVVAEAQEANNLKIGPPIKIGPDLVVSALTVPPAAGAGGLISVSDSTRNQGASAAGASRTGFFLSTNVLLDGGDTSLGSRAVGVLAPGAIDAAVTSLQIPPGTSTGTYFVIAKADTNNDVVESVESNNVSSAVVVRVGPDLTVSALSVPASAAAGSAIAVTAATKNAGGGAAPGSMTFFYLSTNLTLESTDVLVGSRAVGPLDAGASDSGTAMVTIPAGTAAATYFLIAAADGPNTLAETIETNNTRAAAVKITVP
jgi:subtilase family serine protease